MGCVNLKKYTFCTLMFIFKVRYWKPMYSVPRYKLKRSDTVYQEKKARKVF